MAEKSGMAMAEAALPATAETEAGSAATARALV